MSVIRSHYFAVITVLLGAVAFGGEMPKVDPQAQTYEDSVAFHRQKDLMTRGLLCRLLLDRLSGWIPSSRNHKVPVGFDDLERRASEVLGRGIFDYVAGGAGSERTIERNREAFTRWQIRRRVLRGKSDRSLQVTLLGHTYPTPFLFAPIGGLSEVHRDAELAVTPVAAELGIPFVASTMSSRSIETIAATLPPELRWFQLYWTRDEALNRSFVHRAESAGYGAIVVTVDQFLVGWRERDLRNAYMPFLLGRSIANFTSDPEFNARVLKGFPRLIHEVKHLMATVPAPALNWEDLKKLREMTELPILVKGITDPQDAERVKAMGCDGVIVSNHGGRQIDNERPALEALPEVVRAVGPEFPVLFDSGIRRGPDALIAVALGAKAVLIGRPWVYGMALAGRHGVGEVMRNLIADLYFTMGIAGHAEIRNANREWIEPSR